MKTVANGFVAAVAVVMALCANDALADCFTYNTPDGTMDLGADTQINSTDRFIIFKGTVNLNEGASIKCCGNATGSCNFIGIENSDSAAALNINGGTFWCAKKTNGTGGYLAIGNGIDVSNTSTLTLNSGILKVEAFLRSSTQWDDTAGVTASGAITINGGEATVGTIYVGASTVNTGTSTLNLNGGTLTTGGVIFRIGNGQVFTWGNGTLIATQDNIFTLQPYNDSNTKTRTLEITGNPSVFDTAGFEHAFPAFSGTGTLRVAGGGTVVFSQASIPYDISVDADTKIKTSIAVSCAGAVTLAAGAKICFDVSQLSSGEKISFTAASFSLPEGESDVLEFVEESADYSVQLVNGGKTIEATVGGGVQRVITAEWTGLGTYRDVADPANWKCYTAQGTLIEGALPTDETTVVVSGTGVTFQIPDGYAATVKSITFGDCSLGADCDWSTITNAMLANGATLDLNGHDLKIAYIASEGLASVTNSAAGVKPRLWRANASNELDFVDAAVAVDTATVLVQAVNDADIVFPRIPSTIVTRNCAIIAQRIDCEVVQNGGNATVKREFDIGFGGHYGIYTMNGGTLTATGSLVPGGWDGGSGEFRQFGGTVNANSYFVIGFCGGVGTYYIEGGELNITKQPPCIGQMDQDRPATGIFDIAGGVVNAAQPVHVGDVGSTGILRVRGSGILNTPGILSVSANSVEFDGGTVKATAASGEFMSNLTNVVFAAGGLNLDANGFSLGISNCVLKAAMGAKAITFAGAGTLAFTGTTLELSGKTTESYVFAEATGEGTFTSVPSLNLKGWSVKLSTDSKKVIIDRNGLMIILR